MEKCVVTVVSVVWIGLEVIVTSRRNRWRLWFVESRNLFTLLADNRAKTGHLRLKSLYSGIESVNFVINVSC